MQRPAPQPALIRSSLLEAGDSVGLSGELEPVTMKMPMKIPMRVPTKPHPGREGRSAHPLESSDEESRELAEGQSGLAAEVGELRAQNRSLARAGEALGLDVSRLRADAEELEDVRRRLVIEVEEHRRLAEQSAEERGLIDAEAARLRAENLVWKTENDDLLARMQDQPTTGGTLTPDSCRRSANGLSTPPDTFEPFTVGGGKATYLAPGAAPALLPPGLGQSPYSFGMPFDADPAEGVIDHALVMQGIDARYTAESLLEEIYHSGFAYPRDIHLFYLPCDAAGASMGRCFLAFDAVSTRNQFIAAWQGKRMLLARLTDAVSFATVTTKDVLSLFADCKEAISEEPAEVPAAPAVQGRASRFCTRCGGRVDAQRGDKFCAACGAPVRGA